MQSPAASRRWFAIALFAAGLAGCTALRADVAAPPSKTIVDRDTRLARAFEEPLARRPGRSGVAILEDGPLAWLSRVALADVAERTIDLQYYIYDTDGTGLVLLQRLVAAADRGVRVRILLDDVNTAGRDLELARIDRHPNVQVRVYNPLRFRERWTRPFQYAFDLARANRRMHNKIFAVDATAAIVGGRNIGDNYFSFDRDRPNFRDVDLLVVGPAAFECSRAFDVYWNSPWAYPAQALVDESPTREEARRLEAALDAYAAQNERYRRAFPESKSEYLDGLLHAHENLVWARVEVVVDPPGKASRGGPEVSRVAARIGEEWDRTHRELLVESAYFAPRAAGVARFAALRRRGVAVKVLTNSLASTDVAAVHAGYAKYRPDLLRLGVELHEFRREAPPDRPRRRGVREEGGSSAERSSEASLHSKVMTFDRRVAWVGSFNLDPRSRDLNSEIGLFVHSPAVAARLAAMVEANLAPERSWRVELDGDGDLVWIGARAGQLVREDVEPDTTAAVRALVRLLAAIPGIDSFL